MKTDPEESDLITIKHGENPEEELVAYPLGTKIIIKHLESQIGGGGTNTAVAFSRLGLRTGYVGKIGMDENGEKIRKSLEKEGITFLGVTKGQNGYSVILDSSGNDRTILTYKGANNELDYKELDDETLKAKGYYLCSMVGKSFQTLENIAIHAKKQEAIVAFNPSSYLVKEGTKKLKTLLEHTDVLIFNHEEAQTLAGFGNTEELCARLTKLGPKTIVITKGDEGVTAYHEEKYYQALPPKNLQIHETTGAGDAFGSTLFASMLQGIAFEECIKRAMINAESVIANYGAKNILLTKKEIEKKSAKDKRKITKN